MDATWRTLVTLCRECDWSKPRLVHELQSGLQYRTVPPGHTIDWRIPTCKASLDESAVTILPVRPADERIDQYGNVIEPRFPVTIGVEVMPLTDAPLVPEPSSRHLRAPSTRVAQVSEAALRRKLKEIVDGHPQGTPPLDEKTLHAELEKRLGARVVRDRFRAARDEVAPGFKRPRGRARKNPQ